MSTATIPDNNTKESFQKVRQQSEKLCEPLAIEDYVAQPVVDVSPPRWHLAHTTWFFETFILSKYFKDYRPFHPDFAYLFNSYYVQAGERWQRAERGYLTRPTVQEIIEYRKYVDEHMGELLENSTTSELERLMELGLNHEQQHQELLLYDIKYILGHNPLFPKYTDGRRIDITEEMRKDWFHVLAGTHQIGYAGEGFHFDNERGVHTVFLHDYEISTRLVSSGEFLEFVEDGGYERTALWLDEGAKWIRENEIKAPMYWLKEGHQWMEYTLNGLKPLDLKAPLVHVSFYEADAFARWKGNRLPTEQEWEVACRQLGADREKGNFVENEHYRPVQTTGTAFLGNVWEWTASAYRPYPFYQVAPGALGEYNGKFMINQMVLRGGSFGTPRDHIRTTYRNFFHPHLRWHFAGIRLARDI